MAPQSHFPYGIQDISIMVFIVTSIIATTSQTETHTMFVSYPCSHGKYPPSQLSAQKTGWFDVDLDQKPEHRWTHIIEQFEPQLVRIKKQLMPILSSQISPHLMKHNIASIDQFYDLAFSAFPSYIQAEMRGVYEKFPGVERNMLVAMNLMYELTTACTSIVARKSKLSTDHLIHGRNMDGYGIMVYLENKLGRNYLRNSVVNVNFWRSGKIVSRGAHFVGLLFPMDGLKSGKFSFSINQRSTTGNKEKIIGDVIDWAKGEGGAGTVGAAEPLVVALRHLFEEKNSYKEAKAFMESTPHLSAAYFILGGVSGNDACIVTSGGVKGPVKNLPNATLDETNRVGTPWVLQTNSDHGGYRGTRSRVGNDCMRLTYGVPMLSWKKNKSATPMTFGAMFDVLSTRPVLNDRTTYTSLMEVASGKMETWLRGCNPACKPKSAPTSAPTTPKPTTSTPTPTLLPSPSPTSAAIRPKSALFSVFIFSLISFFFMYHDG